MDELNDHTTALYLCALATDAALPARAVRGTCTACAAAVVMNPEMYRDAGTAAAAHGKVLKVLCTPCGMRTAEAMLIVHPFGQEEEGLAESIDAAQQWLGSMFESDGPGHMSLKMEFGPCEHGACTRLRFLLLPSCCERCLETAGLEHTAPCTDGNETMRRLIEALDE